MGGTKAESTTIAEGAETIGMVISNDRGHEAYDEAGRYVCTYPSLADAAKALRERRAVAIERAPSSA